MKFSSLFSRAQDRGKAPDGRIVAIAVLLLALIGGLDYLTGYEVSMGFFYLVPISLATWMAGLRQGLVLSFASAVIWLLADLYSGHRYSNFLIPYWNAGIRLGFFLVVTLLLHQRRLVMEGLEKARGHLEEEVEARTAELRKANEILAFELAVRKEAEEALKRSAGEYRHLFESANDAILIFEPGNELILVANGRACQMYGFSREELIGMSLKSLTQDVARGEQQLAQLFQEGSIRNYETVHLKKDGTPIDVLASSALIEYRGTRAVLSIHRDITEIKQLEQQFRQAQRMEAVGRLAGGVAHDFNNLMNVILGYSELLLEKLGSGDPARRKVEEIHKAGERAASLTRQLLAFSRKQVLQPTVLDLNSVVAEMEKMLRCLIAEDIALSMVLDPELGQVRADPGQIEQVIMNLAVNARDAMPHGGKLTLETANAELDEAYARSHRSVQPGSYVMLAVSDTGSGMNAETQAHIFEPFFTTKDKSKGMGLGLATVYGIVKQSGGYIWVYSEWGHGTTIKIYLPRIQAAVEEARQEKTLAQPLSGQETILLVEDEEAVRGLARESLEKYGYTVLEAGDGAEALRVSQQHKGAIHLVLTDVVMPRMSGRELARRLESSRPRIKVLFMSGYTGDSVLGNNLLDKGQVLLQKPFRPADLARKVRQLLDEEGRQR